MSQVRPVVQTPRLFVLHRVDDLHGVSGEGIVAYGVEWPDGKCATRFVSNDRVRVTPVSLWDRLSDVQRVHGHGGRTRVVYLNQTPTGKALDSAQAHAVLHAYDQARQHAAGGSLAWLDAALAALSHMPGLLARYDELVASYAQLMADHAQLIAQVDAMQAHLEAQAQLMLDGSE